MRLLEKFRNQPGLLGRLMRGGAWLGMGSAAENAFRFARNMILARLLAPEAFGVMAIVLSVCSLFQVLTGLGVKESIVQNPRGAEPSFLNGAWWLASARGFLLYLVAFVASPFLARFYNAPELQWLLRVAFLNVVAASLMSPRAFLAVKQMKYRTWVKIQQGGSLIGITSTILLAFWLRGVVALVAGFVIEGAARATLSYLFCPFRPQMKWNKEDFSALLKFTSGMFGLPVLMLIYNEGAVFAVGKICSKQDLGIFAMALTLARIPTMFSNQIVDLLMPAFCEIQTNPGRVNRGVMKVTTLIVISALPAAAFLAIWGPEILSALYRPFYAKGAAAMALLFLNETLMVCSVPMATVYMAVGKPALVRRFSVIRAICVVSLAYPFIKRWGITGGAAVPLTAMLVAFRFQLYQLRTVTGLDVWKYLRTWGAGIGFAGALGIFWLTTASVFKTLPPALALVAVVLTTAGLLGVSAFLGFKAGVLQRYLPRRLKET